MFTPRNGGSFRGRRSTFNRNGSTSKHSGGGGFGRGEFRNRSPFGRSRRNSGSGKRRGFEGTRIDESKFINKAVITEEVDKFIPEHKFTDFALDKTLLSNIQEKGYMDPTPIQDRSIPQLLRGRDIVGIANTGTGKTAAFLIPLIQKVKLLPKSQILIVVPTRELAIQIESELKGFTKKMQIFSVCCVGGAPIGKQIAGLKYFNNFVIGTPGRLKDLVERSKIVLHNFETIVLDEADRMLDMGFVNDMRYIMDKMTKERHTLFFSATLSHEIEGLIKEFLKDPVRISVKTGDTSRNVDQDVVRAHTEEKLDVLHELLNQKEFSKVLVFGKTKHGVEKLSKMLQERGFRAESIHGDKSHSQRQRALTSFKGDRAQILVATDVAARGLDIDGVSHVINYDLPMTYEDYVHRIGRTGRGNKRGKALTFIPK